MATKPGRPPKPSNTTEQILQTGWTWEVDINPVGWMGIKAVYEHFYYNRDVNRFLSLLDTTRAVSFGVSGFSNTLLSGFPDEPGEAGFPVLPGGNLGWIV